MKPQFLADADLHFDIGTGVPRKEPAIDFESAQELLEEGLEDPDVLAVAAQEGALSCHTASTRCRVIFNVSWPSMGVHRGCS